MSKAFIAGSGTTPFGSFPNRSGRELFAEAGLSALSDAGIDPDDIDEVFYGNFLGSLSERQGHQGPLAAEALGTTAPSRRVESACASSGLAVRDAVRAVRSGESDIVVAGGMERMSNMGTEGATDGLARAADELFEVRSGVTFPAAYALMARAYFNAFGGDRKDLAHVAVKNHDNALVNDHAHLREEIAVDDVLEAPELAAPFGLYDSCPISDGAAAVVLVSPLYAAEHGLDTGVAITGTGHGGDTMALQDRRSLAKTPATREAATEAYDDAEISPSDVAFAEVHDCFTIAEVLALEGLGLYGYGEAVGAARRGETRRDGELPINLSGGLKAKGHPVGATGAAQIAGVRTLLEGTHPRSDALGDDATVGLAHNAGGTVASATVHVLEVVT
ncbi:beta-ketoacyl synthase N-terminal-like domain-containing protein [Natronococcus sp. A-GB7]|uniref:thiolase C-terminal domain-containing protein n=1 Tax=Natronococcus sp. A-GB7 TaxID=3037649 RepID=UPI00241C2E1E|nr:beta-ketoacyl synthase N-terminal-like domain-containing protein [Natronococcus sp. A-GB7]MDG5821467.1 beta-ketoacyl synthase N-terminal-like domain-containing protein [Natronococcus sp. A-GB7]